MARWRLKKEKQKGVWRWCLRQGNKRLPADQYTKPDLDRNDEVKLRAWMTMKNHELDAQRNSKKRSLVNHAYINDDLLAEYEARRNKRTDNSARIPTEMLYLSRYVINFFVGVRGLPNPKDWRTEEVQDAWWEFLDTVRTKKGPLAPVTKQDIVGAANRFITWLRERRGSAEVPEFKLNPVSATVMKRQRGNWRAAHEDAARTALPEADWIVIKEAATSAGLHAHVMLAYCFGLRRGEIAGVRVRDAGELSFAVARTLKTLKPLVFEATKSGEPRRVPYWFATQEEALKWVEVIEAKRMTPDQITDAWGDMITSLVTTRQLSRVYSIHDLRHTFVTRAASVHNLVQVQIAAGHSDIRTTMKYVHVKAA